jgi:N-acetylneuraminate synthase
LVFNVGYQYPVHICAELGINHQGDIDTVLRLIDAAKEAGCDSVKMQKRAPHISVPPWMMNTRKATPWGDMRYIEYRERMEFSLSEYGIIDAYCASIDMPWFASVWDAPSLVFIKENFEPPAYKVPSAMLTNTELLQALKRRTVPIILSTGMSTMEEIRTAVTLLEAQGNSIILCHCNSTYPCPPEELNLQVITAFMDEWPHLRIGYSGHEVGLAPTTATVALGACYIERHLTLDRTLWGSDQATSVEPPGFKRLVKDIRLVERALGDGEKRITEGEMEALQRLRGSHA